MGNLRLVAEFPADPRARTAPTSSCLHRKQSKIESEDTLLQRQFDVVIERDEEGYYVASLPQLPACHTQARSLDEVTQRFREAIELCLEVEGVPEQSLEFIGIQRITVAA